ncbi:MAG: hypothetical protein PHF54_03600 [Candidatus Pacebacteria bacterium]|nr:hypothetical protein [Candidatus Paceibacterota bacterium]
MLNYDELDVQYNSIIDNEALVSDTLKDYNIVDISLDDIELINLLNTDYSEAFDRAKKGYFIFRGDVIDDNIVNRKPGIRVSLNNSYNYYNRLLSNILNSWKHYPKRNQSFICTSSYEYAAHWSDVVNLVLPINGTKLGICPRWDMWRSFTEHSDIERMLYFNIDISKFFSIINDTLADVHDYIFKYEDNKEVYRYIVKTESNIKKLTENKVNDLIEYFHADMYNANIFEYIIRSVYNDTETIISCLDDILNPEKNEFRTEFIESYSIPINKQKELWFSNEAIFIRIDYLWDNKNSRLFSELFK